MSGLVPKHGLTGNTKRLVFDALYQRQQGKCFLCGISQSELDSIGWKQSKLQIDHCHATGMIRGLLCCPCNTSLAMLEYAFQGRYLASIECTCESSGKWIEENKEIIFLYMQQERWLPRKDILFHLQEAIAS